ncbi:XRE family transcriptional regulator [Verrucosispora sp. SN26_14.1]|uniref:helix-turn-helix domain-containing protein n=1 Tax=Verrucosispora sp. SN26_14.1 TaxID=2527879 RepID=UPI001034C58B|nr:helix-turn-helix transcriptional regulator [Verrucosispora sp. SN26_14.1]TBL29073.1 XRE family transcriptional regulator [Verrucosispora sp. SN26_14.1]
MDEGGRRERLAQKIKKRRLEDLGLSVSAAARAAGIDRATWTSAEKGDRDTQPHNWAGIERALNWRPGSIAAILEGGHPTPATGEAADEELELVRTDPRLSDEMRERITTLILERRERDKAAAIEETRRMIDLFKRG